MQRSQYVVPCRHVCERTCEEIGSAWKSRRNRAAAGSPALRGRRRRTPHASAIASIFSRARKRESGMAARNFAGSRPLLRLLAGSLRARFARMPAGRRRSQGALSMRTSGSKERRFGARAIVRPRGAGLARGSERWRGGRRTTGWRAFGSRSRLARSARNGPDAGASGRFESPESDRSSRAQRLQRRTRSAGLPARVRAAPC